MIYPVLNLLTEELNNYMLEKWGNTANGTQEIVALDNIATINDEKNDLQDKIIVTLIKVEEEPTLKNGTFYKNRIDSDKTLKHPSAVNINLYLLFAITKRNYKEGLQLLSDTLLFFQSRKIFQRTANAESEIEFRMSFEMQQMPLPEVFELWSNLGNKQYPFVVYKARVLRLFDTSHEIEVPVITETKVTTTEK